MLDKVLMNKTKEEKCFLYFHAKTSHSLLHIEGYVEAGRMKKASIYPFFFFPPFTWRQIGDENKGVCSRCFFVWL